MAAANKKKQKMKGKTLNLTEFLGDAGPVMSHKPVSWAEEMENTGDDPDEDYGTGSSSASNINRAVLPTAPRAARGPNVDMSQVPTEPPFTAFLGNLPFDVSEEEIEKFFYPLVVKNIRIPPGRSKGFGYAEFEDRQALLEALERNDATLRTRQIRIDLADQHGGEGGRNDRDNRDWGRGRREDDGEDKTQGDWRRAPRSDGPGGGGMDRDFGNRSFGDRDRGGGFSRGGDRFGDRGGDRFGDRGGDRFGDRGGDRYGDRGGDRYGDRGGDRYGDRGGDRYGDRGGDRYGDRGGDRYGDRGGDRYGDRGGDRYGDRRGGDRYGDDGGYGRRSFGSGYGRDSDRRDGPPSRGFDRGPPPRDNYGTADGGDRGPSERRKLNLQPRSKPKEEETPAAPSGAAEKRPEPSAAAATGAPASSIFGAAKPVDTAARERQIEEKILREKRADEERWEQERENRLRDVKERERKTSESKPDRITRQDSDSSQGRQRKSSSSSIGKGIRTVAPPPGAGSARVRRDSALSDEFDDENVFDEDKPTSPRSPPSKIDEDVKLVPAPPPKENVWAIRKDQSRPSDKEDHDKENRRNTNSTTSPSNKLQGSPASNNDSSKNNISKKEFVAADPPKENVWTRKKQEQTQDNFKGKHWGSGERRTTPNKPASNEQKSKRREKPLPTSIDEMPKYEENKAIDISDTNKFGFLVDEDVEGSD